MTLDPAPDVTDSPPGPYGLHSTKSHHIITGFKSEQKRKLQVFHDHSRPPARRQTTWQQGSKRANGRKPVV